MVESGENRNNIFLQDTVSMAKNLLGRIIITEGKEDNIFAGYIVETEAYLGTEDMACHSYGGKRTPKIEAMYMGAGTIYIYTMHTHKMLNIVTREEGNPQAVLIRGIEPLYNIGIMELNRGKKGILVTNGPGKLTKAMEIDDRYNMGKIEGICLREGFFQKKMEKLNLKKNIIYMDINNSRKPRKIMTSARVGIPDKGIWTGKNLRFYVRGNKFVSGMKKSEFNDDCWE